MKSLRETIIEYMKGTQGGVATLKQINKAVYESDYETKGKTLDCSIRTVIYRNEKDFKRIGKGLYLLQGEKSCSLLLQGDGRGMEELEDKSIDLIITDHPWEDKKAHKSGNQKGFAEYDTFIYTQEDFNAKSRVLKDGSYLVEFLPVESETNWEYLSKIKQYAKNAGFKLYASCLWRNAPEGTVNTGRTTKGVQQFIIFSKGKARRLSPSGKPYMTRNILNYEVEMLLKAGEKHHQAEKPLALYKYLIENLTEEEDVCLDQFGGACNMVKAAIETHRYGIAYELSKQFALNAVKRFGMQTIFEPGETSSTEIAETEVPEVSIGTLTVIPADAAEFQKNFLYTLEKSSRKDLLTEAEWNIFHSGTVKDEEIHKMFCKANRLGYAQYQKPVFDIDMVTYQNLQEAYKSIDDKFEREHEEFTRPYYENVRIENQCFAEFKALHVGGIKEYLSYLKEHFPLVNTARTERILTEHLYVAC